MSESGNVEVVNQGSAIAKPKVDVEKTPDRKPTLRDWVKVLTHTHSKLRGQYDQPDFLINWQDGQLTTRKLVETVAQINKREGGLFVVDSDHAAHALDEYHPTLSKYTANGSSTDEVRALRAKKFAPDNIDLTIQQISDRIEQRRLAVVALRESGYIQDRLYTGVEVDLLNAEGKLDVSNEILAKHEYVGVSIHRDEWKDANHGKEPTLNDVVSSYESVANNPAVDVLNHFIRELPANVIEAIKINTGCFDKLFSSLVRNNKALEINLRDLVDPRKRDQNQIMLQLLSRAKSMGVRFIIGSDFHRIEQYLPEKLSDDRSQKVTSRELLQQLAANELTDKPNLTDADYGAEIDAVLQQVFKAGEGAFGLPKNYVALMRPIYLAIQQLQASGLVPSDIINSDDEKFKEWIKLRQGFKY